MPLIERQVIKPNHRFYSEADRLSLLPKKLDNCDNYIYRQNFLPRQPTNAMVVDRALKKSVNDKALSAPVTENTLRLQQKAGTNYNIVALAVDRAIVKLSFK